MPKDLKFETAYSAALRASIDAAIDYDVKLGPEQSRGLDCGFAWVELRPATHPFVRWLKKQASAQISLTDGRSTGRDYGDKGYNGGWHIWNPSQHHTQSIGTKEAGARAFRNELVKHACTAGLIINVGSRFD